VFEGDSGTGAMKLKDNVFYVYGITSSGYPCGSSSSPGVYTRVEKFIPWIVQTVWPESVN
jgi:secreted trypsin-like serine protease